MWRSRRWRKLLSVLEGLPRTSAYAQALALDEDLAEQIVDLPDTDRTPQWRRSHREYTPEVEMLTALFDRIGELIRITAAMRGARSKPPPYGPRPTHAIERVRKRIREETHKSLVSRLINKPAG